MHWAAHKHTAAEVIYERADAEKRKYGAYLDIAEVHAINKEPMPLFVGSAVTPAVQFADIFVGIVRQRQKAGNLPALNL